MELFTKVIEIMLEHLPPYFHKINIKAIWTLRLFSLICDSQKFLACMNNYWNLNHDHIDVSQAASSSLFALQVQKDCNKPTVLLCLNQLRFSQVPIDLEKDSHISKSIEVE